MPEPVEFRVVPAAEPPASVLIGAMVAEVESLYGPIQGPGMPSGTPADFSPPGGACVVGFDGEVALCVGAVKRLADEVAEIKRMYVAPTGRSRGLARALLVALEDAARDLGYLRVRLDTGTRQPHAKALYLSTGYVEIADYNGNTVATFWAEKQL